MVVDRWTISRRWETLSWYTVRETKVPYRAPISSSAATNIRAPRPPAIRCPKQEFFFVLFLAICAPYRNIILRRFQGHSSALYRLRPGVPDGAQVLRFKALLQQGIICFWVARHVTVYWAPSATGFPSFVMPVRV